MISFNEAIRLVSEAALPIGSEKVAIADAAGRRLASPVVAMIDSPPTDVSAMDGYAVRDSDLP
jgi:molybdopterin molybdotransferase